MERSAVLVLDGRVRQLAVLAISTAQISARMPAPTGILRLATISGHVLALPDPRTLVVVEPRGQREVATIPLDRDVRDFAVDPAGGRIAIRDASGGVELLELRELIRWCERYREARRAIHDEHGRGGVGRWRVHVGTGADDEVDDVTDERAIVVPEVPLRRAHAATECIAPCARVWCTRSSSASSGGSRCGRWARSRRGIPGDSATATKASIRTSSRSRRSSA